MPDKKITNNFLYNSHEIHMSFLKIFISLHKGHGPFSHFFDGMFMPEAGDKKWKVSKKTFGVYRSSHPKTEVHENSKK